MANTSNIAEEIVNNSEEMIEETAKQTASFWERHPNLDLIKNGSLVGGGMAIGAGLVCGAIKFGKCVGGEIRDRWNGWRKSRAKAVEETKDE